jgi:hypothetical protein
MARSLVIQRSFCTRPFIGFRATAHRKVRPQGMLAHFSILAASVDIKLPDWVGYAMLTAAVLFLVAAGLLICRLLKKKKTASPL